MSILKQMQVSSFSNSDTYREKYPNHVPIIMQRRSNDELDNLTKSKFLVPKEMPFWQFIFVLRRSLSLSSHKALFVFTTDSKKLLSTTQHIQSIYATERSADGCLRLTYASENAFGESKIYAKLS